MKLVQLPDKTIRERSEEVALPLTKEDEKIIEGMIQHIDDSQRENSKLKPGVGIAAVQVGALKRMFYVNVPASSEEPNFREFLVNPKLVGESPFYAALSEGEGCLSVANNSKETQGLVHRKFKVVVEGYSYLQKKPVTVTKTGYHAIVLQHELDHLDGKLFFDRINEKDPLAKKPDEILV